jgi:hypothetical protein
MDTDDINQSDFSLQEIQNNQAVTTMEWTSEHEVQLQRNTTEQQNRNRRSTRNKKKRKKKKTWLIVNNDNDINTLSLPY